MQITSNITDDNGRNLSFIAKYNEDLDYLFMSVFHNEKLIYDNQLLTSALSAKAKASFGEFKTEIYKLIQNAEMQQQLTKYFDEIKTKDIQK